MFYCIFKICCTICVIFLQNAVYFIILSLLVRIIFAFYIKGVLKFKCPPSSFKGQTIWAFLFQSMVGHISKLQKYTTVKFFFVCVLCLEKQKSFELDNKIPGFIFSQLHMNVIFISYWTSQLFGFLKIFKCYLHYTHTVKPKYSTTLT
jgi:hypothetical protein